MKIFTFIFLISLSCNVCAQKSIFVRIYNLTGERINKGQVLAVTDSSLQLEGKEASINIPVSQIGFIKTKRSAGNNLFKGSIIGASTMAILGAATSDPDAIILGYTAGEGAASGVLIGLPVGAAIGGLTILFKNSKTYLINGDLMKWRVFQSVVSKISSKRK
jgi:hypothetical protein